MLPNIPTFIYGDTEITLTPSLPITPWARSLRVTGGDTEAESGVRTGYVVRRDELLTFDLRFHEEEWPDIQAFMDFAQSGQSFFWYPDTNDLTFGYEVCLDAPASGSTYQSSLDDFIRVQHLRITLMQPGNPAIPWHELNPFERRIPIVPPGPLPPVTLEINPQINAMGENAEQQLTYEFRDSRDEVIPDLVPTLWTTDNPDAVTVDEDTGLVATAEERIPFVIRKQNELNEYPWQNAGAPVVSAGDYHDTEFWRVLSTSLPKQQFYVETDGDEYYATVFVRADGEDEDDEDIPLGTFEGGLYDVTDALYVAKWRFTVTAGGGIAVTTLAGTLIRQCTLTDLTRAFTFKTGALDDEHEYEFRLRSGGTVTSLLCAFAILTAAEDPVAVIKAFYDVGAVELESNDAVVFADDDLIISSLPEVPYPIHISGRVTFFGVGGGGGGSTSGGGGGGRVDGNTINATGNVTWALGDGGAAGAPFASSGGQTTVNVSGFGLVIGPNGGGGAGSFFGGTSMGGTGGAHVGIGCGLDGSCSGGGGGAGALEPGHDAMAIPTCPNASCVSGQGGDGFPIFFERRFIAVLGGGGGGGAYFEGSCGASPGGPGSGGGGIGGENGPGSNGADFLGGGAANGARGGKGTLYMIWRPSEATVTL